jgi:hypothetical protein
MSASGLDGGFGTENLRERLPNDPVKALPATTSDNAKAAVRALNDEEDKKNMSEEEKKTYGRTPDGTGSYIHPKNRGAVKKRISHNNCITLSRQYLGAQNNFTNGMRVYSIADAIFIQYSSSHRLTTWSRN